MKAKADRKRDTDLRLAEIKIAAVATTVTSIITSLIKWAGIVAVFYFGWRMVDSLSGKETNANILMNTLLELKADRWVAYILAGGAVVFGFNERLLRKRKVAELTGRNSSLEKLLDQKRSSSTLPATGDTRSEDR